MHKGVTNLRLPRRNLAEYLTQPNLTFFLFTQLSSEESQK